MSHPRAPILLLMCGVAFSGKTTLSRRVELVQRDALVAAARGLGHIGPEDIPLEEWERSSHDAARQIDSLLQHGQDVVLDDTNCYRFLRDRYRAVALRHAAPCLLVHLPLTLEQGLARIAGNRIERSRPDFPEPLYRFHFAQMEAPEADEPHLIFLPDEDPLEWVTRHESRLRHGADNAASFRRGPP